MGYHPFDKYPDTFGRKPNISVPSMNTENMNQINNPVIDKKMIDMICNLVCSSSSSSSSSDTYEFTGFQQHSKETLIVNIHVSMSFSFTTLILIYI